MSHRSNISLFLNSTATGFRKNGYQEIAAEFEQLSARIEDPCEVAVVGQVKAGKSSFINAILKEDLARVGTTETTATINYFRFGNPDPQRPVRCHWRGGHVTDESRQFLDSLQGSDSETLRRAEGIDFLEFFVPNPYLKEITLIDTPGTGAVVGEHQRATEEFLQVSARLRQRHDEETRRISAAADAVIYLIGTVAKGRDQELLKQFNKTTTSGSYPFNAVGVISKIDLSEDLLRRRQELSEKIARQLKGQLNTVLPVSPGLRRALDRLLRADGAFERLLSGLASIPTSLLTTMLSSEELFREEEFDDCPSAATRNAMFNEVGNWSVFRTIAEAATGKFDRPDTVLQHLNEIAGFDPLRQLLDYHFLRRGEILHCYRILRDARSVLEELRYTVIPHLRETENQNELKLQRFRKVIATAKGERETIAELTEFLKLHLAGGSGQKAVELYEEADREWEELIAGVKYVNDDFEVLQKLDRSPDVCSEAESEELRALLGSYGLDDEQRVAGRLNSRHVRERMQFWKLTMDRAPAGSTRKQASERAWKQLGYIQARLLGRSDIRKRK